MVSDDPSAANILCSIIMMMLVPCLMKLLFEKNILWVLSSMRMSIWDTACPDTP